MKNQEKYGKLIENINNHKYYVPAELWEDPRVTDKDIKVRVEYKKWLRKQGYELDQQFKQDLFVALGIENHPKRERLYEIAWEEHGSGYMDIMYKAEDLAELLD